MEPGRVEGGPLRWTCVSDPGDSDCHGVDGALKARETSGCGKAWTSTRRKRRGSHRAERAKDHVAVSRLQSGRAGKLAPPPGSPAPCPWPHPAPREDEMQIPSLSISVPYLLLSTPTLCLLLFPLPWLSLVGQDGQFWCADHEVNFFRVVGGCG